MGREEVCGREEVGGGRRYVGRERLGSGNEGCIKGRGVVRERVGNVGGEEEDYRRDGVRTTHLYYSLPSSSTCRLPMTTRRS